MTGASLAVAPRSIGWRRARAAAAPTDPARRADSGNPAADRILRRLGLTFGLAGVVAAVVEIPEMVEQARHAPPVGTVAVAVLTFGAFPVLALVGAGGSARAVRLVAACAAVGYLLAMALAPVVYQELPAHTTSLWLYRVLALGVLAAALAWSTPIAVGYLVIGAASAAVANRTAVPDGDMASLVGDFARAVGLCVLFLWCVVFARAAAARLDRESEIAGRRAATVAAAAARDSEQARFAALIHDAVLSTLLDASRAQTPSPVLRGQAERTLTQLDEVRGESGGSDRLTAGSVIGFLRAAVAEVNPGIEVDARRSAGAEDLRMPATAVGTLAAALGEAARNSLRHAEVAGRAVRRVVTVSVGAGGVQVVFADDGAGFDLARVSADRLGITVSILGRMRRLPGGAGFVDSEPGRGTTVTLVWGSDG